MTLCRPLTPAEAQRMHAEQDALDAADARYNARLVLLVALALAILGGWAFVRPPATAPQPHAPTAADSTYADSVAASMSLTIGARRERS